MRITHLFDVRDEFVRHRAVIDVVAVGILLPRAEMNLVDVDRRAVGIVVFPFSHPLFVFPAVARNVVKFGSVCGRGLEMQSVRVALKDGSAALGRYRVFVRLKLLCAGNESRPYAVVLFLHTVGVYVPVVKIAHDRNGRGVGCPYGEIPTVYAVFRTRNGREHLIRLIIRPFVEQITCITVMLFCHYFLQKQIPYQSRIYF